MEGERLASGAAHADNVAPALLGGIILVRSYDPLDIVGLHVPPDLYCVVIHPETAVSYTHLRANETVLDLVCRLLLENKK